MAAAVVPAQHPFGSTARAEHAEDALEVGGGRRLLLGIGFFIGHAVEEARGRKLPGVPHDDRLAGARDGSEGVHRSDLTGLVEDDEIETDRARWKKLGDGQGAHHEDGLDLQERVARLGHQLAKRKVPPLLLELATQDGYLPASLAARQAPPVGFRHQGPVVLEQVEVELPEALDEVLMAAAIELGQRRIVTECRRDQRGEPRVLEMRGEMSAGVLPGCGGLGHRFESVVREPGFLLVEPDDVVERVEAATGTLKPRREGVETTVAQDVSIRRSGGIHFEVRDHGVEGSGERLHRGTTALRVGLERCAVERPVEKVVNGGVEPAGCLVGMQFVQPGYGFSEQSWLTGVAAGHSIRHQALQQIARGIDRLPESLRFQNRFDDRKLGRSVGR